MRTLLDSVLLIAIGTIVLCHSAQAIAIYENDFSSDPLWTTNDSANMYWDSINGWYHVQNTNGVPTYAYVDAPIDQNQAYRLEWDIFMVSAQWSADIRFGIFDADLETESAVSLYGLYGIGDLGTGTVFGGWDSNGRGAGSPGYDVQYDFGVWYHNVLEWSPDSQTVSSTISRIFDNYAYPTLTLSDFGPFAGVDRIGVSQVGHTYGGGQVAEAYIDNVRLVTVVPEPSSMAVVGLGLTGVFIRRFGKRLKG